MIKSHNVSEQWFVLLLLRFSLAFVIVKGHVSKQLGVYINLIKYIWPVPFMSPNQALLYEEEILLQMSFYYTKGVLLRMATGLINIHPFKIKSSHVNK